jgi:hypothetical protein
MELTDCVAAGFIPSSSFGLVAGKMWRTSYAENNVFNGQVFGELSIFYPIKLQVNGRSTTWYIVPDVSSSARRGGVGHRQAKEGISRVVLVYTSTNKWPRQARQRMKFLL